MLHFVVLAVLWGCSFALIAVCLESFTPIQVAFWRLLFGAVALASIMVAAGRKLPRSWPVWGHLSVVAMLLNAVPFALFAFGQQYISSTLAAIINAATPLMTLLVVVALFRDEKPTTSRLLGFAIGFLGILVVFGVWRSFPQGQVVGISACLAAIVCYGIAFPYSRRFLTDTGHSPVSLATTQVALATSMLAIPVAATGTILPASPPLSAILAMLVLGVACSGIAYVLNYVVIDRAGASTASSVTYLTPLVAAAVGVVFLNERLSWNEPVGCVIVLTGIAISQGKFRRR